MKPKVFHSILKAAKIRELKDGKEHYVDEQIFALAHEIYHFITKTGKAYETYEEDEDEQVEKKADRFAAELLLPDDILCSRVVSQCNKMNYKK